MARLKFYNNTPEEITLIKENPYFFLQKSLTNLKHVNISLEQYGTLHPYFNKNGKCTFLYHKESGQIFVDYEFILGVLLNESDIPFFKIQELIRVIIKTEYHIDAEPEIPCFIGDPFLEFNEMYAKKTVETLLLKK